MLFKPKSELINIEHWGDVITVIVRKYLYHVIQGVDKDKIDVLWGMNQSLQWIRLRIDDEFNSQMKWAVRTTNADDYLIESIKNVISIVTETKLTEYDKLTQEATDAIYQDIDIVETLIIEQCTKLISPNPWCVWTLKYRQEFIAFESDYDYRIKAFEELYDLVEAKSVDDMMDKIKSSIDKSS